MTLAVLSTPLRETAVACWRFLVRFALDPLPVWNRRVTGITDFFRPDGYTESHTLFHFRDSWGAKGMQCA